MAKRRLPKMALKWIPKQERARGRPKKNWMEGIKKAMNERNLNEGQLEDRKQWSLGVGQLGKRFETDIYIYIYITLTSLLLMMIYIIIIIINNNNNNNNDVNVFQCFVVGM
jgi:hypothetical protein